MSVDRVRRGIGAVLLVFMGTLTMAFGAAYKDGEIAPGTDNEVHIGMIRWGNNVVGEDRVVGKVKRYGIAMDLPYSETIKLLSETIIATFDAYSEKRELLDTVRLEFDMVTYGYKRKRDCYEAPFCVDFKSIEGARKISLVKVTVNGESRVYRTHNISNDIMKTGFSLPEPKAIPIKK